MKINRISITLLGAAMPFVVSAAAAIEARENLTSSTTTLGEKVYFVTAKTQIDGSANSPALKVEDGKTAVLFIPKGVTLTVNGGNSDGLSGAGAGISVPRTSKLIVTGEGELIAKGGNAHDGDKGGDASSGFFNSKGVADESSENWDAYGGYTRGGAGGYGGGGAGAAIGGNGGKGTTGTAGGYCELFWDNRNKTTGLWYGWGHNGGDSANSQRSEDGVTAGDIYLLGTISLSATGGSRGNGGGAGAVCDEKLDDTGETYEFVCCKTGGGAGGGGGAGPVADVGGGGDGGCGGTGGASGVVLWPKTNGQSSHGGDGLRGDAGFSSDSNTRGAMGGGSYLRYGSAPDNNGITRYGGGSGTPGNGEKSSPGGCEKIVVDSNVKVSGSLQKKSMWTGNNDPVSDRIRHKITFNYTDNSMAFEREVFLGYAMTDAPRLVALGKDFDGWVDYDGILYYDPSGNPWPDVYDLTVDLKLKPKWTGSGANVYPVSIPLQENAADGTRFTVNVHGASGGEFEVPAMDKKLVIYMPNGAYRAVFTQNGKTYVATVTVTNGVVAVSVDQYLNLQALIDATPAGGTLTLGEGNYLGGATINKSMTLTADNPENTIVDGLEAGSCLTIANSDVTVRNIKFQNGAGNNGGGICSSESNTGIAVSNCEFRACRAIGNGVGKGYGGALYWIRGSVEDCVFEGNSAERLGGAAAYCDSIDRCIFTKNSAQEGGAFNDCALVQFSLFVGNEASRSGGAGFVAYLQMGNIVCCTFADNTAGGSKTAGTSGIGGDGIATVCDCLFYNCKCTAKFTDCIYVVTEDPFMDAAGGNYLVKSMLWESFPGDESRGMLLNEAGALDLALQPIQPKPFYIAGCYAPVNGLQALIDLVPEGEVLKLSPGTYRGPATINKPMTLTAEDPETTIIDGKGKDRGLSITSSDVIISNLRFANCAADHGGAIYSSSSYKNAIVSNCVFRSCQATEYGGALSEIYGLVIDCVFERNKSADIGGAAAFCERMERCIFKNNSAKNGGAVHTCQARFSLFVGNDATSSGGAGYGNNGAHPYGGQYYSCTFVNNTVNGSTDDSSSGLRDGKAYDCLFCNCKTIYASRDYSYDVKADAFQDLGPELPDIYCLKENYQAQYVGNAGRGSTYRSDGSRYVEGTPVSYFPNFPAGCYAPGLSLQLLIDITDPNETCYVPEGTYSPAIVPVEKQGITLEGVGTVIINAQGKGRCLLVLAQDVTVSGFAFMDGYAKADDYDGHGGGVRGSGASTTLAVTNCTFSNCKAANDGGGICYVKTLVDCDFTDCQAGRFGGGSDRSKLAVECSFDNCSANDSGGGAALYATDDVVRDCTFYQCYASNYGGGVQGTDRKGIVDGCLFTECKADVNGGGGDALGMVTNCIFTSCTARDCAGGICNTAKVSGSTFIGCLAENKWGGGIHNVTTIESSWFEDCFANLNGGGIDNANAIWSCLFLNNSCGGQGGGANYVVDGGVGCINCTFVGNTSGSGGQETEAVGNMPTVRNCLFYANAAPSVKMGENGNYQVTNVTAFTSTKTDDYHLRLGDRNAEKLVAVDIGSARGRPDIDGDPLVNTVAKKEFYYSGCYGYVPWEAKGMEVNVADDVDRPNTAVLSSLRETLQDISDWPDAHLGFDGCCTVEFADSLFKDREVLTIPLAKAQMTVDCKYPVVLRAPNGKRLVLDGGGEWRALYVTPQTEFHLENVTLTNCLAVSAGAQAAAQTSSGGALVNDGALFASGCVFTGNAASGGSKITPAPTGFGGAMLNRGAAVVERCTFAGNSAAAGGAICNTSTGRLTVVSTTFAGNRAIAGGTTVGNVGGNGGAIAQITTSGAESPDTLLVNCTLTGNVADGNCGAIYAQGTSGARSLFLADVVAAGNVSRQYEIYLQSGVGAEAVFSVYGDRNAAASDGWFGVAEESGKGVDDLFADVTADGTAALPTVAADGQITFPLLTGLTYPTVWVRHNEDWTFAGYATDKSASTWSALRAATRIPPREQRDQLPLLTDQLGGEFTARPALGATIVTKPRTTGPDVPPEGDPRVIATTDPQVIVAQLDAVNSKAKELARGGVVTVSFDPAVTGKTVAVDRLLAEFTGFTDVSLVIEGPITLDGGGWTRFFTIGEGNTVEFRDVTFANGRDTSAGGAVLGERCDVTFTRCTFRDCTAPYGGAVCLDYADSRGLFTDCVFAGNSAGIRGAAVYNDMCSLRFIRTEIRPEDVEERLRVLVEHSPRQIAENPDCETPDAFANTAEAVRTLEDGCTLVLLNADAERDLEVLEIPAGVTVTRRYARVVDGAVIVEGGASSLQEGIDLAKSEGVGTVRIAPGRYAPVTIPSGADGLVLAGTDPSSCVIDGALASEGAACVVSGSANVTVSNLLFRAGRSGASGGGVSGVKTVIRCAFDSCSAAVAGGGVAGDGSTVVKLSVFRNCTAPSGAAVSGVKAYACTFVDEGTVDGTRTVDADSALCGCLAAGCTITAGEESYSTNDPEGDFVRPGEDYSVRVAALWKYPADGLLGQAKSEGWTDVFGRSPVVSIAGRERLFAGAFAPEAPDQSLQAMIDAAPNDGVVEIPSGTYGPATVPSEKGGLTLRPEAGAKVTVDGMGLGSALTLRGAATVEGLTITGGAAETGGGVSGAAGATVRSCVIVGNRATVSGGGVSGVTAENCTFVGNAAPSGAAAANSAIRASLGVTAGQTLAGCGTPVDWFTAAEGDFADFARGDYSIPEANWARFTASDENWAKGVYADRKTDFAGRPTVRRVAGEYVGLAGAYGADYDDTLQRMIDFTAGNLIEVPDGSYRPFVVERDGVTVAHAGGPAGCAVDGSGRFRGAGVTGANVTISGMAFRNCAAESGGGVYGAAAKLRVENCVFEGCTADLHGGAVYATGPEAVVTGCAFAGNSATDLNSAGGALYAADALVAGCFFRGNSAVCAGALAAEAGTVTIGCTFVGNAATGAAFAETASAAYTAAAGLTLADCVLFGDTQTGFGEEGRTLTPAEDPFVASGSGDWRLRSDLLAEAVDFGSGAESRIAAVRDAGAVMPGGRQLVASLAGEDVLFAGAYGLAASNELQELIDRAEPGQEITVAAGEYLPAVIPADKPGLTLTGSGAAVIDGRGRFRCLTVRVGGVTLKGLTFANGWTDGDGGGVGGGASVAAVIDCTFTNCVATGKGGGIAGVGEVRGCRFVGNAAGTYGGGLSHTVNGDVIGSLFVSNTAQNDYAVCRWDGGSGALRNCTFYGNFKAGALDIPTGGYYNLSDGDAWAMVDPAGGDFRLRPELTARFAVDHYQAVTNAFAQGWIGADGEPLARAAGDWAVMTRGAINCWDMTLQEAVDGATMGATVEVAGGVYPPLFVGSKKSGVTVRAKSGERVTINGNRTFRCVTDASEKLTLAGLVITNGVATGYCDIGRNGGGYCGVPGKGATLAGCTVAGCAAVDGQGGGVYGADAVLGSKIVDNRASVGGGVAGSALVRGSLIRRNQAKNGGGGVYGRLGTAGTAVKNCTFVYNRSADDTDDAGLSEGADIHNLYYSCHPDGVTNSTGKVVGDDRSVFVNYSAGDWRIARGRVAELTVLDFDYAATARSEGWTTPDGDPLVTEIVRADVILAGAYGSDADLRLQRWIDEAKSGDTVEVPAGTYAPVAVDTVSNVTIVAKGECVIDCAGLCRGVTVEMPGVTIDGFTIRNGDMARWIDTEGVDCTGGAILGDGSTTVASGCTFTDCRAQHGGATAWMGLVSGCSLLDCAATGFGGGSYADVEVRGSLFEGNSAEDGGAAAAQSALSSCTLVSNGEGDAIAGGSVRYSVFVGNAVEDGTGNLLTNESFFAAGTRLPTMAAATANLIGDAAYVSAAAGWTGPDGRKLVFAADGAAAMTVGAYAPQGASPMPTVAAKRSFRMTDRSGGAVVLENAAGVAETPKSGMRVEVETLTAADAAGGVKGGAAALLADVAEAANASFAKSVPWYTATVRETDGLLSLTVDLNETARPELDEKAEIDMTGSDTEVAIRPANVKPGLWYGLGRGDSPTGPFEVPEGGWVQADEHGELPESVRAAKSGATGFYRVIVTDEVK